MTYDFLNIFIHAIALAERGLHVFPCHWIFYGSCSCQKECGSPGKHPMPRNGFYAASSDLEWIRAIAGETPHANIGLRTGRGSGCWVLDEDGDEGIEALRTLEAKHGPLPKTWTVRTGSGGRHHYFKWPAGLEVRNSQGIAGLAIDVRGEGGYVIAPPSSNANGVL